MYIGTKGPSNNYVTVGGRGSAEGRTEISGTYVPMNSHRGECVTAVTGGGSAAIFEKKALRNYWTVP